MVRDFTMAKYGELCRVLLGAGYTPVTVYQYLTDPPGGRTVVLRHDVDRKPENALKMAELEHALGVCSTYYFRHPHTFIPRSSSRSSPSATRSATTTRCWRRRRAITRRRSPSSPANSRSSGLSATSGRSACTGAPSPATTTATSGRV
jgi:hypothetical protein